MQQSQDQSVIEDQMNECLPAEDMCEHHRIAKFQEDIQKYSVKKNEIVTKLKDVQNQISLSINENSYMN